MSNGLKVIKKRVTEDKKSSEETETSKQGEKEDLGSSSKSPRRSWAEVLQRNLELGPNFGTLNSAETITIREREDLSDMGLLNKQVGRPCDLSGKSIEKFSSVDVDEIGLGKMDPSQAYLNLDMCNVISNDSRAVFSELVGGRKKEGKMVLFGRFRTRDWQSLKLGREFCLLKDHKICDFGVFLTLI
ncbi:hypothetical protein V6N12_062795 [Hibiscus sabdariffa]|uniref:Uncharacterized protein n=1 Tax=Hibiscus sabdariffa TaxID=183260 RepID=A0ABR2F9Y1_9ROSI